MSYRRAVPDDLPAIIDLCRIALRWSDDARNEQLFRWKHLENPFGESPMWVAESAGRLVGFRAMMQWRFRSATGVKRAVRAVDTATHPDFQRRGIFSALNQLAIDSLTTEGVDFVFNTPNAESLPGYLKQGWVELGRVSIAARPTGLRGVLAMPSALGKASKWSEPLHTGTSVDLVHPVSLETERLSTDGSAAFFHWRYASGPVAYRAVSDSGAGLVIRLRNRGKARELVIAHSWGTEVVVARLLKEALQASRASYAVGTTHAPGHSIMVPLPPIGPHLTVRSLASPAPSMNEFALLLGDVELF